MAHKLTITFSQETDGHLDGETLVSEYSEDPVVHAIKTKVFTKVLTAALNQATDELTDMSIELGGGTESKKVKR